jgi:hypothetical protein
MADRVKVILPEDRKSESEHVGKYGVMTALDKSTGRAEVEFDDGELVTIDACCLQYQDGEQVEQVETFDPDDNWTEFPACPSCGHIGEHEECSQ